MGTGVYMYCEMWYICTVRCERGWYWCIYVLWDVREVDTGVYMYCEMVMHTLSRSSIRICYYNNLQTTVEIMTEHRTGCTVAVLHFLKKQFTVYRCLTLNWIDWRFVLTGDCIQLNVYNLPCYYQLWVELSLYTSTGNELVCRYNQIYWYSGVYVLWDETEVGTGVYVLCDETEVGTGVYMYCEMRQRWVLYWCIYVLWDETEVGTGVYMYCEMSQKGV